VARSSAAIGLVDIGGRSLFLDCRGSGQPTVVLEAGLTGDHRTWEQVVPKIRSQARVCTYDRANIGSSQPAPTPRTAADMVDDLNDLLHASGEPPPYLLVGFSFGGLATQLYARSHPDQVAGLVLVESNHPREAEQFEAHLTRAQIAADHAETNSNPEGIDVYTSFEQVRATGRLPHVPLVVVTAGRSDGWPPGWDAALFDRLRAEQQADLAHMVPGGKQVVASNSGHDVPDQQPEVVVDAIRTVLAQLR
jgi:pimeloyl-ACP methyl ester carboxylesterase